MRGFEKTLAETYAQLPDAVFVISTWRNRGGKIYGALNWAQLSRLLSDNCTYAIPPEFYYERLYQYLPALEALILARISAHPEITVADIHRIVPHAHVVIETEADYADLMPPGLDHELQNTFHMLLKIRSANDMKSRIEAESGEKFDLVIRIRPDFTTNFACLSQYDGQSVFIDGADHADGTASDILAFSTSGNMDRYSMAFDRFMAVAAAGKVRWNHHRSLYHAFVELGLSLKALPWLGHQFANEAISDADFIAAAEASLAAHADPGDRRAVESVIACARAAITLSENSAELAIAQATNALALNDWSPEPYRILARAFLTLGHVVEARRCFITGMARVSEGVARGFPYYEQQFAVRLKDILPDLVAAERNG